MPNANNYLSLQQPQFVPRQPYYPQMLYGNNNNNNILSNNGSNYIDPASIQLQQYQQNTYGMPPNNNISPNNTTNTNNCNASVPAYQTMQQQNQNNSNTHNINNNGGATNSDGGNPTEKNNETVFCDLTKGFCLGCKLW